MKSVIRTIKSAVWMPYLLGALVGAITSITTVDQKLLLGRTEAWNQVGGDSGVSLAVFRYFVEQGFWSNPFNVRNLGIDGVSVAANDAIPLLAHVARFVSIAIEINAETWFGFWLFIVFVLQGASAVYAVRGWSSANVIVTTTAAVLSTLLPSFLQRSGHIALLAQFWLFIAIGLVGRFRLNDSGRSMQMWICFVPLCAWLTHPYLGIMTAGLIGVPIIFKAVVTKKLALAIPFGTGVVGSLAFASTDVSPTTLIPDSGSWSWLGASLLSPVIPQRSDLIDVSSLAGVAEWEAMNWLGLGAALIVVIGLLKFAISRSLAELSNATRGLLFAVIALTIYSLTVVTRLTPKHKVDFRDLHPFQLLTILGCCIAGCLALALARRGKPAARSSQRVVVISRFVGAVSIVLIVASRLLMGASGGRLSQSFVLVGGAVVLAESSRFSVEPWRSAVLSVAGILWAVGVALLLIPGRLELLTSTLRGSGRFMWPMVALLLVASLVSLARIRVTFLLPICVVAVLLQISDTQGLRAGFSGNLMHGDGYTASSETLRVAMSDASIVHIRPTLGCLNSGAGFLSFYNVVIAASRDNVPVDPAVRSRAVKEDCASVSIPTSGSTVAVVERHSETLDVLELDGSTCSDLSGIFLCRIEQRE